MFFKILKKRNPTARLGLDLPEQSRYVAEPAFPLVYKKVELMSLTCLKFSTAKDLTQP
jgi:hypothetical protein